MQTINNPDVLTTPFADQGQKNTIPVNPTGSYLASQTEGFPAVTMLPIASGGEPPAGEDMNGVLNLTSQHHFFLQNGGQETFRQAVSDAIGGYPQGAILWYKPTGTTKAIPVMSLIGNNTYNFVTDPSYIDGVHWSEAINTGINNTNCLTNVPQDINLEISNNNLVLKAGSKVYVPNGFEQDGVTQHFDVITIANDISGTVSFNGTCTVVYRPSNNGISLYSSAVDSSGSTDPSVTATFYNTTQNIMKRFDGASLSSSGFSFPIARVVTTTSGVQSIKEVSNGFGYIGSTVFALPGVTGLIPNGRNADGTLKSTSWAISNVITRTFASTDNGVYVLGFEGAGFSRLGYIYYRYDEPENMQYNSSNQWKATLLGFIKITNGVINNVSTKTVFHAFDYNDISFILGQIYPIGALYIGTQSTCPMSTLMPGTTWSLVSSGRALWTGNGTNGNTTIAAGLPNITGGLSGADLKDPSGAFSANGTTGSWAYGTSPTSRNKISFNARSSNTIYGNSSTVQPPAYVVNVWRRTA